MNISRQGSRWLRHLVSVGVAALILFVVLAPAPVAAGTGNVVIVNTTTDDGPGHCDTTCTLRDAVAVAHPGDTITFDVSGTITLTQGPIVVDKDLTISGGGWAGAVVIDGGNAHRIFTLTGGTVRISGVTLQNGYVKGDNGSAPQGGTYNGIGGAIHLGADAALLLENAVLSDNAVVGGDGGHASTDTSGGGGGVGGSGAGLGGSVGSGGFGGGGAGSPFYGGPPGNGGFGGGGGGGYGGPDYLGLGGLYGGNGGAGTNGYGGGGGGAGMGGAIFVEGALALANVAFENNSATGGQGGTPSYSAAPGGGGAGLGSAIFNNGNLCVGADVTFSGNTVAGGGPGAWPSNPSGYSNPTAGQGVDTTEGIFDHSGGMACATWTEVSPPGSLLSAADDQSITLSAAVSTAGSSVGSMGTVTFTVLNGNETVGTPQTAAVSDGLASTPYLIPGGTAPGIYTVKAEYSGDEFYLASTDSYQTLIIAPTATTTTVSSASATYSGDEQPVTVSANVQSPQGPVNGGSVRFTVVDGSGQTVGTPVVQTVAGGTASADYTLPAGMPVGTYTLTAEYLGIDGQGPSDGTGTLMVVPAPLTVMVDDAVRPYGGVNPAFTGTIGGIQNNDNVTATYSTTATVESPVGTYAITATLIDPEGKLSNYDVTITPGTLTVTPAPLTVTVDDTTRLYGAANPSFTGTVAGIQNGDNITASYSTTATAASPVGDYDITATLNDPDGKLGNYDVTNTPGTLTVSPAPLSVTVADATRTYGDANPTFTGTVSGIQNNDDITATYSTTATPASDVGTYGITATLTDPEGRLSNYDVTIVPGTLTVTPAPLTVKVNDARRRYGRENPTFTGTITGIKNNDNITATYSTTATVDSPVGTYEITATLHDPDGRLVNYEVTIETGTLTIYRRPVRRPDPTPEPEPEPEPAPEPAAGETDSEATCAVTLSPGTAGEMLAIARCTARPATVARIAGAFGQSSGEWAGLVEVGNEAVKSLLAAAGDSLRPRLRVEVPEAETVTAAVISGQAVAGLAAAGGDLQMTTGDMSLLIPSESLQPLTADRADASLLLRFEPARSEAAGEPVAGAVRPAVNIALTTVHPDGTTANHHQVNRPLILTLTLDPEQEMDRELLGIYRLETAADGSAVPTYVGGQVDQTGAAISTDLTNLGTHVVLEYRRDFADVSSNHWAYRPIQVLAARHVIAGVGEGRFDPDRPVTGAEFATLVQRILQLPAGDGEAASAAESDAWYARSLQALYMTGILDPDADDWFRPDQPMTRQAMVVLVSRTLQRLHPAVDFQTNASEVLAAYADASEVAEFARSDMANMVAAEIVQGRGPGRLAPLAPTTRAEAAALVYRMIQWQNPGQ